MKINKTKCVGCANCVPVCPMGAITITSDGFAEINREACVECFTCYRGLSVEYLPPAPVRTMRRLLAKVKLRFQPDPDICPTEAIEPEELVWPRILRRSFSDPQIPHESTGLQGRGTAEVKTNDVTNRIGEGEVGFVIELGRPGVGVYFREVDRVAQTLAANGVTFEKENPVTHLMDDPARGRIRNDVLDEKVLSCIIESKTEMENMTKVLNVIRQIAPTLDTVVCVGVSTRCDEKGEDPLKAKLEEMGFSPKWAKINLGLGRRTHTEPMNRGANS